MSPIRVLLFEDHSLIRRGVEGICEEAEDVDYLGGYATSAEDPWAMRMAYEAGAAGVVRKAEGPEALLDAIRTVNETGVLTGLDWASALESDVSFVRDKLNDSERRPLLLYTQGCTSYQIAHRVHCTVNTVNSYVRDIRKKYIDAGLRTTLPTRTEMYIHLVQTAYLPGPCTTP